jgi:DeoR/GlpR family transcriptional regulator of sugar metabolism
MKPEVRQHKILNLISAESGISASKLAKQLHVSRMTIHRDLSALAAQGQLRRIHGGALYQKPAYSRNCPICHREPLAHQQTELITSGALKTRTCCTTCGLLQILKHANRESLWVHDLLTGRRLAAEQAYFLINSAASSCCQPSILSFVQLDQLALFQTGFGGTVARLNDALDFLRLSHHLHLPSIDDRTDNQT